MKIKLLKYLFLSSLNIFLAGGPITVAHSSTMEHNFYLYKILSLDGWIASQELGYLQPQSLDDKFIHLAEKHQIDRIVAKYWPNQTEIFIAKINPSKVIGELVYEANPGGTNKYYHLYAGKIPLDAVVETFPYQEN